MSFWGFRPYVSVAQRRAKALKEIVKLKKKGKQLAPVVTEGRSIAKSFWGKAWCENLERYSDFENRLPRGRTYVNNGSVIDLRVERGKVEALVSGSEVYNVKIEIAIAAQPRWKSICADCAGSVASIVELLHGKLSKNVMERVCREDDGLFPKPNEIKLSCSCPDWADMCKHVAATLYGIGARLDRDPEVLFALRGVDRNELISTGADLSITEAAANNERILADDDMAALFGLEIETAPASRLPGNAQSARGAPDKAARAASKTITTQKSKASVATKVKVTSAERNAEDDHKETKSAPSNSRIAKFAPKPRDLLKPHVVTGPAKPEGAGSATRHAKATESEETVKGHASRNRAAKQDAKKLAAQDPGALRPTARLRPGSKCRTTPANGRTRAAKWIGAKARRSPRD